jgi:hypothetical protein
VLLRLCGLATGSRGDVDLELAKDPRADGPEANQGQRRRANRAAEEHEVGESVLPGDDVELAAVVRRRQGSFAEGLASVLCVAEPVVEVVPLVFVVAWPGIEYPEAIFDEDTDTWVSRAEVAKRDLTGSGSRSKAQRVPGRLVARRIPDLGARPGQGTLFEAWRFHAFFTTSPRP